MSDNLKRIVEIRASEMGTNLKGDEADFTLQTSADGSVWSKVTTYVSKKDPFTITGLSSQTIKDNISSGINILVGPTVRFYRITVTCDSCWKDQIDYVVASGSIS